MYWLLLSYAWMTCHIVLWQLSTICVAQTLAFATEGFRVSIDWACLCMELPLSVMEEWQTFHMLLLLSLISLPDIRTQCLSKVRVLGRNTRLCHFSVDSFSTTSPHHHSIHPPHLPPFPPPNFSQPPLLKRARGEVIECRNAFAHYACVCVGSLYSVIKFSSCS